MSRCTTSPCGVLMVRPFCCSCQKAWLRRSRGPSSIAFLRGHGSGGPEVVVLQVAVAVLVDQDAALAARALGDQDAGAGQPGRMVLDELHVLERHAGAIGHGHAVAGLDRAVGGEGENPPGAAGRDDHRLGLERDARGPIASRSRRRRCSARPRPADRSSSIRRSALIDGYFSEVWKSVCSMWKPVLSAAYHVRSIFMPPNGRTATLPSGSRLHGQPQCSICMSSSGACVDEQLDRVLVAQPVAARRRCRGNGCRGCRCP